MQRWVILCTKRPSILDLWIWSAELFRLQAQDSALTLSWTPHFGCKRWYSQREGKNFPLQTLFIYHFSYLCVFSWIPVVFAQPALTLRTTLQTLEMKIRHIQRQTPAQQVMKTHSPCPFTLFMQKRRKKVMCPCPRVEALVIVQQTAYDLPLALSLTNIKPPQAPRSPT